MKAPVGPSHEQVAYLTGVQVAQRGSNPTLTQLLVLPVYKLHAVLTAPALVSLTALKHERWAHYVREGYESQRKSAR